MPANRYNSSRLGLVMFLLVAMIIAAGFLFVWPKYKEWKQEKIVLGEVALDHAQKKKTVESIDKLIKNYKSRVEELENAEATLPGSPNVPQLLANIEELVLKNGMKLSSLMVTDLTLAQSKTVEESVENRTVLNSLSKPELVPLKIDITVFGQYSNFTNLLDALEKNQRLFEVKSITTQPVSDIVTLDNTFTIVLESSYLK